MQGKGRPSAHTYASTASQNIALAAALLALETSRQTSPTRGFEKKFFPGLEPIYGRQAQQSPSLIYEFLLLSQSYGFVGLAHTYCGVICYVVNLSI